MLRPFQSSAETWESPIEVPGGRPSPQTAFHTSDRPIGVRFYRPRDAFFVPYHGLQWMGMDDQRITLRFPENDLVLEGQALHSLFVALAEQRVSVVIQQVTPPAEGVFVRRIERIPRRRPVAEHERDPLER